MVRAFGLLKKPPFEFQHGRNTYRLEISQDSLSQEWRLWAIQVSDRDGNPWLLHRCPAEDGLDSNYLNIRLVTPASNPRYKIFLDMVKAGAATVVE
jgi:hypothetical protein